MSKLKDTLTYPLHKIKHNWIGYVIMLIGGTFMAIKGMSWFLIGIFIGVCAVYFGLLAYKLIK